MGPSSAATESRWVVAASQHVALGDAQLNSANMAMIKPPRSWACTAVFDMVGGDQV